MNFRKFFLVLLLSQIIFSQSFADNDSLKNVYVKVSPGYGVIIRHREAMGNLMQHAGNLTIEIGKQPYGKNLWEQLYNYPEFGAGYYIANLNDPKILGYVHAIYAYLNSPIIRTNKFTLKYQIAIGTSYTTKHFDFKENYTNLAIGSHLNAYFNLQFNAAYRISPKLEINTGIGGCHYSNGAFKQPNLGINVTRFDLGIKYYIKEFTNEKRKLEVPPFKKKNEFNFILLAGTKTIPPIGGPNYLMSTVSFYLARQINHKRKIGIGTDIFYDETLYAESEDENDIPISHVLRNGIYISHEFLIERLSIAIQLGVYTYTKFKPLFPLYTRLALRYNVTSHIFANISLKAHLGVADFIEWGIGYRFQ